MDVRTTIYHYCNYQERCHAEVRNKLYELGCRKNEVEQYISELIENDCLNEERFAKAYARGKFRMLRWGRTKIVQQLQVRKISAYCIKKALTEIDPDEYEKVLEKLASKKWKEQKARKNAQIKKGMVYRYLVQKGYEGDLVKDIINEIIRSENTDGK